ncbi:MAG TPA: hypothetical protein VKD72_10115, partial [Gemmataceae bacterium]|nr:hypothetical protein [Gemmataceae bacterium]
DLPTEDLILLAGVLSGHRIDAAGNFVPLDRGELAAAWQNVLSRCPDYFVSSAEEISDWQRHQAEARWHDPASRADRRALVGDWKAAATLYARATEAEGANSSVWSGLALCQLKLDDVEGYRKTRDQLIQRFGGPDKPGAHAQVIQIWVVAPEAATDDARQRVVEMARERLKARPEDINRVGFLGAALYRAGRFEEAAVELVKASESNTDGLRTRDLLFLAMTRYQLKEPEAAKKLLDDAARWVNQWEADLGWGARVKLNLLRREAEALILGQKPADPGK